MTLSFKLGYNLQVAMVIFSVVWAHWQEDAMSLCMPITVEISPASMGDADLLSILNIIDMATWAWDRGFTKPQVNNNKEDHKLVTKVG